MAKSGPTGRPAGLEARGARPSDGLDRFLPLAWRLASPGAGT